MIGTPHPLEIAVCSWSLGIDDERLLRTELMHWGIRAVHLALGPGMGTGEKQEKWIDAFRRTPLLLTAGMIGFHGEDYTSLATIRNTGGFVPDMLFETRFARALEAARVAREIGIKLLTTHAGFIPPRQDKPAFEKLTSRLQRVADALGEMEITLGFETGQETAETLAEFLHAVGRQNLGVNFDPANMLLYNKGTPVDAIIHLAPWIKHVHAKDARRKLQATPDDWAGDEVPLGTGDAGIPHVIEMLHRTGYRGAIAIEREGGDSRGKDVASAIDLLKSCIGKVMKP